MICEHLFKKVIFMTVTNPETVKYKVCLKCGEGLPKNLTVRKGVIIDASI